MPPAPYAHIAVCLDESPAAARAVAEGVRLRALGAGTLSLVHVAHPPRLAGYSRWERPDEQEYAREAREWLERRAAAVPGAVPVALIGERPAHRVVEWAAGSGCDLLVVATRGGTAERLGLGGFSRHLAHAAPCPVLLVRPDGG
jgi:universal stress protein A